MGYGAGPRDRRVHEEPKSRLRGSGSSVTLAVFSVHSRAPRKIPAPHRPCPVFAVFGAPFFAFPRQLPVQGPHKKRGPGRGAGYRAGPRKKKRGPLKRSPRPEANTSCFACSVEVYSVVGVSSATEPTLVSYRRNFSRTEVSIEGFCSGCLTWLQQATGVIVRGRRKRDSARLGNY